MMFSSKIGVREVLATGAPLKLQLISTSGSPKPTQDSKAVSPEFRDKSLDSIATITTGEPENT